MADKDMVAALAAAQGEMKNAALNCVNPHFKSRYADLAAIRDTVVPVFAKHGLAVTQTTVYDGEIFMLKTTLHGPGGATIDSTYPLPHGKPQEMGSAITYARRYTLAALAGIAAEEDDDANAAQSAPAPQKRTAQAQRGNGQSNAKRETTATLKADIPDKPGKIPVPDPDGADMTPAWKAWVAAMVKAVNEAQTTDEADAWIKANETPLGNLKLFNEKTHGWLMTQIENRLAALNQAPADAAE